MPDIDSARAFLAAARRDAQALANMQSEVAFPPEIFGFHAQQALEKALKAWLCVRGAVPPQSHNLRHLLVLLESSGAEVDEWWEVVGLTAFAVQFRYEAFDPLDAALDRAYWVDRVNTLLAGVDEKLGV